MTKETKPFTPTNPEHEVKKGQMSIFNHRGVLVERCKDYWIVLGTKATTQKEVNKIIDQAQNNLSKSIVK